MNPKHIVLFLIPALAIGAISAGDAQAGKPAGDKTPPAAVTDLAVDPAETTNHSVLLRWTATGDDGTRGTATQYDVRYLVGSAVTDANWDTATQAVREPAPKAPGSAEAFTVGGLSESAAYYFALKVNDDVGNTSALSNNAGVTTLLTPSGGWAVETASTINSITRQFAFGPGGQVGIAHGDFDGLWLSRWNGTAWSDEQVVGTGQDLNPNPDIAFTPDGSPSMAFGLEDPIGQYNLKFAYRLNGAWAIDDLGVASNSSRTSLVYDPASLVTNPEPTIAFVRGGAVQYGRKIGGLTGVWVTQQVDASGGPYVSLAYGPDGNPAIAYSNVDRVKFARWNPVIQAWDGLDATPGPDVVEIGSMAGGWVSLAFSPVGGQPSTVYRHDQTTGKGKTAQTVRAVHMATWDGSQWSIATVSDDPGVYYFGAGLTYTSAGTPYVAYLKGLGAVTVAWPAGGGTWQRAIVEDCPIQWPELHIDIDPLTDKPAVLYTIEAIKLARMR